MEFFLTRCLHLGTTIFVVVFRLDMASFVEYYLPEARALFAVRECFSTIKLYLCADLHQRLLPYAVQVHLGLDA